MSTRHLCHWPGCPKPVPPKLWGCAPHWFKLPPILRAYVLKEYRPGQEITKTPSARYVAVARIVQEWIAAHFVGDTAEWDALFIRDAIARKEKPR